MLEITGLDAGYGAVQVLREVSLTAARGEITCIMGRNGAGKTTLMKAIMGLVPSSAGTIVLDGARIDSLPGHRVPAAGIGYVPQGRRLFADLTVAENLAIGGLVNRDAARAKARALEIFPRLGERLEQRAGTLSGGEQQMLATARALCTGPKVMLFDEPTEGLQPSMIAAIRDILRNLREKGVAVVLVEQRVEAVLELADRVTFLENGRAKDTVEVAALRADRSLIDRYVGV